MRITIVTAGTRGDVQPYVALGLGLQAAGHMVSLATHADFEAFVRSHGLDCRPLHRFDINQGMQRFERIRARTEARKADLNKVTPGMSELMEAVMLECWQACQGSDAILSAHMATFFADSIAQKLGVPHIAAHPYPISATSAFPSVFFPAFPSWLAKVQAPYNQLSHAIARKLCWKLIRRPLNLARERVLGLPPIAGQRPRAVLYGYSPAVLPKPTDWPASIDVTGYWFLDQPAGWQPPAALVDFLQAGPPPVYIGFGSMAGPRRETLLGMAQEALLRTGVRALIACGEGTAAPELLSENVMAIGALPHDWLFPQVAAVVCHGGAGTTGTALRYGVPVVVVPFIPSDQRFWGRRLSAIGVGVGPITHVTADQLARALATVTADTAMRARAAALGAQIRAENGVSRAVDMFHHYLAQAQDTHMPARDFGLVPSAPAQ
jgi:UDP:flavonoid glycosyltransferase YjiC (YdhE family)